MRRLAIALFSLLTLKSFAAAPPEPVRQTHGPFEIVHTATVVSQLSSSSWRDALIGTPVPMWSITINLRGQKVIAGASKVLLLAEARQPALVLVGGQANHLVTEESGQAVLRKFPKEGYTIRNPVAQWLDAVNGQPGEQIQLATGASVRQDAHPFTGGQLLLLNETVLDVRTLQSWELDFSANRTALDQFHTAGPGGRAYFLSPGRSQIVFVGARVRPTGGTYEHTLIAAEMATNRMYLVPFGPSLTSFDSMKDPTSAWLEKNFVWGRDETGRERLQSRL